MPWLFGGKPTRLSTSKMTTTDVLATDALAPVSIEAIVVPPEKCSKQRVLRSYRKYHQVRARRMARITAYRLKKDQQREAKLEWRIAKAKSRAKRASMKLKVKTLTGASTAIAKLTAKMTALKLKMLLKTQARLTKKIMSLQQTLLEETPEVTAPVPVSI